jgi:5-methylcytosine-specific restriction enzyme subunit McrC
MRTIELTEWETATPDTLKELRDLRLPDDAEIAATLRRVNEREMVSIRELRSGLEIRTTSYVGSLTLGTLDLRIRPKVRTESFAVLVGYALGLPRIELLPEHVARLTAPAFQDLLVARLADESARLLARGIYRQYTPQEGALGSPRGRILFSPLARQASAAAATVPCRYYERDEDVLPNQVLLSGLQFAATLAFDARIRRQALRVAAALKESVRPVMLNAFTFQRLSRSRNRLISAYDPAFALIRLLLAGHGISTGSVDESHPLPGFLFDMNMLFQQALGRFLTESLEEVRVEEQHSICDLFSYQPSFNPLGKRAPKLRPDYVFRRGDRIVGIADAKYRDLWERELGRDMLYQLSVYALSQAQCRVAAILYPAGDAGAKEARITIHDPVSGRIGGEVHLRPVDIDHIARLIGARGGAGKLLRERAAYARRLAFGAELRDSSSGGHISRVPV